MNANALNFDLFAMTAPKSRADVIALAMEIRAELARINGYIDAIYEQNECLTSA